MSDLLSAEELLYSLQNCLLFNSLAKPDPNTLLAQVSLRQTKQRYGQLIVVNQENVEHNCGASVSSQCSELALHQVTRFSSVSHKLITCEKLSSTLEQDGIYGKEYHIMEPFVVTSYPRWIYTGRGCLQLTLFLSVNTQPGLFFHIQQRKVATYAVVHT